MIGEWEICAEALLLSRRFPDRVNAYDKAAENRLVPRNLANGKASRPTTDVDDIDNTGLSRQ